MTINMTALHMVIFCLLGGLRPLPLANDHPGMSKNVSISSEKGIAQALIAESSVGQVGNESDMEEKMNNDEAHLEANKALARRWFDEVINQRNLDAVADIYSADYRYHGPEGFELRGPEAVRKYAASILAASNDRQAVVEQQVAEGDLVVTRFISRGHHTGLYRGLEPTGKLWTTEGIDISRIVDGKIMEDWEIIHNSGL
jgi:predicted SnoaL-like aldol condensation-catalyzing enzyme